MHKSAALRAASLATPGSPEGNGAEFQGTTHYFSMRLANGGEIRELSLVGNEVSACVIDKPFVDSFMPFVADVKNALNDGLSGALEFADRRPYFARILIQATERDCPEPVRIAVNGSKSTPTSAEFGLFLETIFDPAAQANAFNILNEAIDNYRMYVKRLRSRMFSRWDALTGSITLSLGIAALPLQAIYNPAITNLYIFAGGVVALAALCQFAKWQRVHAFNAREAATLNGSEGLSRLAGKHRIESATIATALGLIGASLCLLLVQTASWLPSSDLSASPAQVYESTPSASDTPPDPPQVVPVWPFFATVNIENAVLRSGPSVDGIVAGNASPGDQLVVVGRVDNSSDGPWLALQLSDASTVFVRESETLPFESWQSSTEAQTQIFADGFDRADGEIGNGWLPTNDGATIGLFLEGGKLTTPNITGGAGIFRPLDRSSGVSVRATISQMSGYGGLRARYDTLLLLGSLGDIATGYGVAIRRGDINYNDSRVTLVLNGVELETVNASFQFGTEIDVLVSFEADGGAVGSISGDGDNFSFRFGPRVVGPLGAAFAIFQSYPDVRSDSILRPTIDDFKVSQLASNQFCLPTKSVVYFAWDRSNLDQASLETLDALVERTRACIMRGVTIVGHSDTSLANDDSQVISVHRAQVVRDAIVARGISGDLVTVEGRGEADLASPTGDGVREPLNRRAEVMVTYHRK